MASSPGAGHRPRSPPTRKCAGFIWGTTSGWIKISNVTLRRLTIDGRIRVRPASYGDFSEAAQDRKSTRLNSSHSQISYAVFCLKKKKKKKKKKKNNKKKKKKKETRRYTQPTD